MIRTKPLTRKAPMRRSTKRMKQGRSTGKPTIAQQYRFYAIKEIGCICCRTLGITRAAEIHHLTSGGRHGQKRRGHDFTIGLCSHHHRGVTAFGNARLATATYGPSYALEPRKFRETFGSDDVLLALQDKLIGELE